MLGTLVWWASMFAFLLLPLVHNGVIYSLPHHQSKQNLLRLVLACGEF